MSDPPAEVRALVHARAEDCCEVCGLLAVASQVHHRRPRSLGGSSDPAINAPSNLLLVCFSCHRRVETGRRGGAYQCGWLVPYGHDPAAWPVLLPGECWAYLTDDGRYRLMSTVEDL